VDDLQVVELEHELLEGLGPGLRRLDDIGRLSLPSATRIASSASSTPPGALLSGM